MGLHRMDGRITDCRRVRLRITDGTRVSHLRRSHIRVFRTWFRNTGLTMIFMRLRMLSAPVTKRGLSRNFSLLWVRLLQMVRPMDLLSGMALDIMDSFIGLSDLRLLLPTLRLWLRTRRRWCMGRTRRSRLGSDGFLVHHCLWCVTLTCPF